MKVVVLGAGAWGTSMAIHLSRQGHETVLWPRRTEAAQTLQAERMNRRYLDGVLFPEALQIVETPPPAEAYVVAIPTQHIRKTLQGIRHTLDPSRPFISASKGIEISTLMRPTEILQQVTGATSVGVLSGPSHAIEVARGLPASLSAAGVGDLPGRIQELFMGPTMRVYTSRDLVGVEIAGALKNVIALAAGICDGLGLGDNAKAALITRGAVEMARFGTRLGARPETFHGLAGIGDLIVTCTSRHGRNLRCGREIGAGKSVDEVLDRMVQVAEGVWTSQAVIPWSEKLGVEMPICREVYRVVRERKPPAEAVRDLMSRAPKAEF